MLAVEINGQPREIPDQLNIRTLLAHLGVDPQRVAVELNREIIRKTQWDTTLIENGAKIEIVMFVGGGAR